MPYYSARFKHGNVVSGVCISAPDDEAARKLGKEFSESPSYRHAAYLGVIELGTDRTLEEPRMTPHVATPAKGYPAKPSKVFSSR